jgi:hypothetical protein
MPAPLVGAALTAARIIAKKRAADIAKKKVVKVSAKDAREVAREMSKTIGSSKPLGRSKGTQGMGTRPKDIPKKTTIKSTPKKSVAQSAAEKKGKIFTEKKELRKSLSKPPAAKPSKPSPVLISKKIPTRLEKLGANKVVKYRGKDLILSPAQINKLRSKPIEDKKGIYEREFGKSPKARELLDKKNIERANQIEKEGRAEYLRQMRDSKINPMLTRDPSKKLINPTSEQALARAKKMLIEELKRRGTR